MEPSKVAKKKFCDKANDKLQRISKALGAIVAIVTTIAGVCAWLAGQFQNVVSIQISDLTSDIKESDRKQEQAITRLELASLIRNDPTNKAAIEKMARYYFVVLNGDLYMTSMYSKWCAQYDGDISFVIGDK